MNLLEVAALISSNLSLSKNWSKNSMFGTDWRLDLVMEKAIRDNNRSFFVTVLVTILEKLGTKNTRKINARNQKIFLNKKIIILGFN